MRRPLLRPARLITAPSRRPSLQPLLADGFFVLRAAILSRCRSNRAEPSHRGRVRHPSLHMQIAAAHYGSLARDLARCGRTLSRRSRCGPSRSGSHTSLERRYRSRRRERWHCLGQSDPLRPSQADPSCGVPGWSVVPLIRISVASEGQTDRPLLCRSPRWSP